MAEAGIRNFPLQRFSFSLPFNRVWNSGRSFYPTPVDRGLLLSRTSSGISFLERFFSANASFSAGRSPIIPTRTYSRESTADGLDATSRRRRRNTSTVRIPVVFSESDDDEELKKEASASDKWKMPPPYDPFSKKPAIEEPKDPKDLQQVFHKMKSEGIFSSAVKMFDGLSKMGLTHEALELFSHIKDKGEMPDVIAHTAVIEAYAAAGQSKDALKTFLRMLASGVLPNAYTYAVLISSLAEGGKVDDAKKYTVEMMEKGMRPGAATCASVLEALGREQRMDEAGELWERIKTKGFMPEEEDMKELLKSKRGSTVMHLLFSE